MTTRLLNAAGIYRDGLQSKIVINSASPNQKDRIELSGFGWAVLGGVESNDIDYYTMLACQTAAEADEEEEAPLTYPGNLASLTDAEISQTVSNAGEGSATIRGFTISGDGLASYIGDGDSSIRKHTHGAAWDITTFSSGGTVVLNPSSTIVPSGLRFGDSGLKFYIAGQASGAGIIQQHDLTSVWDLTTANVAADYSLDVSTEMTSPRGIAFSSDGTKLFVNSGNDDYIYQYTLSIAWRISTGTYDSVRLSATPETALTGVEFNSEGSILYLTGTWGDQVYKRVLTAAWDLSTAPADADLTMSVRPLEYSPQGMILTPDTTKMFVAGTTTVGGAPAVKVSTFNTTLV